jgi:hypothetical protein
MAGLVPAIYVFDEIRAFKTWMPGRRPGTKTLATSIPAFAALGRDDSGNVAIYADRSVL